MLKTLSRSELEDALKLAMSSKETTRVKYRPKPVDSDLRRVLAALSGTHRLAIIDLLRGGPQPARQIALALELHRANFSRHLKELVAAGLVVVDVSPLDARERIVSLRREAFDVVDVWVRKIRADA